MKLQGIVGTGSGKLGASVFSVRRGEQIVRSYQPVVADPKTSSQLAARAKMKLMVQLGAMLSQGIGFRREGNVSPRNKFFRANYAKVTMSDGSATIPENQIDISGGSVGLSELTATHASGTVTVSLRSRQPELDRVVYVLVEKVGNSSFLRSIATAEAGDGETFQSSMSLEGSRTGYVLAYGFRFIDSAARVHFENMVFEDSSYIVAYVRSLYETQVTLTRTSYVAVAAEGQQSAANAMAAEGQRAAKK